MALKKLPSGLQTKLHASFKIRSFKRAVEELVYNAFDANSSSIAVRVDIKQNYIQVVDNGHGVAKGDLKVIGECYTTSKYKKSTATESVQTYGCFGQSLANLIEVSQNVTIISKCMNNEETWMKHFCNGKEESYSIVTDRPSAGTTVEIKGFLYNLPIQKKAVKALQELQNIKTFLEQMALIQCNTSISLRDDYLNEINFQVHKNRDVVKTLSSVLNICTNTLQEFQVEKNEYKVTGFIQNNNEDAKGYQWMYVNNRFIDNSNLHKTVNENLAKFTPIRKNIKFKKYNNEDGKAITKNTLPDYFIFIKCPKNEYDVVSNNRKSIIEFKNLTQINKLLDKLVKFYITEVNFVKAKETNTEPNTNKAYETDTRNKIKQIMKKILGSQQKKMSGSNFRNGVKAKLMFHESNRSKQPKCEENDYTVINKHLINNEAITPCLTSTNKLNTKKKTAHPNSYQRPNKGKRHHLTNHIYKNKFNHASKYKEPVTSFQVPVCKLSTRNEVTNAQQQRKHKEEEHMYDIDKTSNDIEREPILTKFKNGTKTKPNKGKRHHLTNHIYKNKFNRASKDKETVTSFQVPVCKLSTRNEVTNAQQQRKHKEEEHMYDIDKTNNDIEREPILTKFKKITEVQKRCCRLSKEVDHLLKIKKRRCKIFTHETIQYSNYVTDNKSVTVRQKVNEIIIHEYVPLKQKSEAENKEDTSMKNIKKSNDLLRPVSNIINHNEFESVIKRAKILQPLPNLNSWDFRETRVPDIPGPTYDSHGYLKDTQIHRTQNDLGGTLNNNTFVRKISVDNLISPAAVRKVDKTQKVIKSLHDKNLNHMEHSDMTKTSSSSYCPNFTETDSRTCKTEGAVINTEGAVKSAREFCSGCTYTITHLNQPGNADLKENSCRTCTIDTDRASKRIRASNSNLYIERSPNIQNIRNNTAASDEPLNNNIVFISNSQFAITGKNVNEQMEPICETVIESCDKQVLYEKNIENTFTLDSTNNIIGGSTEPIEPIRICEAVLGSYEDQNPEEIVDNILLSTNSTNNLTNDNTKTKAESGDLYEFVKEARPNVIQKADTISDRNNNNTIACDVGDIDFEPDTFNLMYRRRYIPKGMSPIFLHCNSKKILNFELDADCYAPIVYNNFAQNVEIHSEIYKPKIQNVNEAATRDLQRADMRLSKDNACLTFNSGSLQNVKVLGQVDRKFIATILNGGSNNVDNFLVLFDQHAVHERIRLEQNMSDYLNNDLWNTVSVDGISLKLNRDDILYLHNYRDKFERLGLQWSITSDTQVLVTAIPAAILGKHLRQVDVILKAVNNMIKEEISIIKEQGGCVSLYPKSIMDLVFSEACRHAIMFGTTLNVPECSHLIEALSRCLTPFQCAHGRPALAVLVDIAQETRPYTVNFTKVELFRKTQIKNVLVR